MEEQSNSEKIPLKTNPNWEEALNLYKRVTAGKDEALQVRATIKLAQFSNQAPNTILEHTIPILVKLLDSSPSQNTSPSIQEAASYCLTRIASKGDGDLAINVSQTGAILSILRLLPNSDGYLQKVLVKLLWNLMSFGNASRSMVVRNGGLEVIVNLLGACVDGTRRYLLEILSTLALLREVRRVITGFGGLHYLVEAAKCGSMISRERASQAIGLLGVTKRARRMLVELGAIPVLVELFRNGDGSTKLVAGNALGVISAHVDSIRPVAQAGAIPLYAELLGGPDPVGKEIAEDVFCILAVAEGNAVAIADHLVIILCEENDESISAAVSVLWDLSGYNHSASVIRNSGAIPIMVELLRDGSGEVKEKVSGAITQLSYNEVDRLALADSGAISILIDMLQDESEELRDNAAEALIKFAEDPLQRDRISGALDDPSFQNMQNRLVQIRASDELMVRSMRRMSVEQLTWDPDLVFA